jgi:hypothetical protein
MDYIYQIGRCTHITQSVVGKYPILEDANHYAWYDSFELAEKCVTHNLGDIHETIYDWVIIEQYEFNVSNSVAVNRWVYKFDEITEKYKRVEEPECLNNSINLI